MHAPSPTTGAPEPTTFPTDEDRRAGDLISALSALPIGHPSRGLLRQQVIQAWSPMARRLARRYDGRGEPSDDLAQTAMLGLIKAVDRFDPTRGVDFVAYAIPTIIGEIRRYFRDRTWSIRAPRRLQEMRLAINEANRVLTQSLGHIPTVTEIASYLMASEEEVLEGLEGARAYRATSLSAPAFSDSYLEISDTLGSAEHGYELTDLRLSLEPALLRLNERDRDVLTLRFYGNQTQAQIAEQIGVSQMQISRIITRALAKLREDLGSNAR